MQSHNEPQPLNIGGITVYRIGDALRLAGVSRATYFRWVKEGKVPDSRFRDRNKRRVLTVEELRQLQGVANVLIEGSQYNHRSASERQR